MFISCIPRPGNRRETDDACVRQWILFVTESDDVMLIKILNKQHIWSYGELRDYRPVQKAPFDSILSSNSHVTLRLTVFEIFAVRWQKIGVWEDKNGPPESPLFDPDLDTPEDIATKKQTCREYVCHRAKFNTDRWHHLRDICLRPKKKHTPADLIANCSSVWWITSTNINCIWAIAMQFCRLMW